MGTQVWDIKLCIDRQVGDAPVGEIVVFPGHQSIGAAYFGLPDLFAAFIKGS